MVASRSHKKSSWNEHPLISSSQTLISVSAIGPRVSNSLSYSHLSRLSSKFFIGHNHIYPLVGRTLKWNWKHKQQQILLPSLTIKQYVTIISMSKFYTRSRISSRRQKQVDQMKRLVNECRMHYCRLIIFPVTTASSESYTNFWTKLAYA